MSGIPLLVEMEGLRVLVVGGGGVAARKVSSLVDAGASVRVVAPEVSAELRALADAGRVAIDARVYSAADIRDADLVIAATNDRATNARVAQDARAAHRLVSVVDAPEQGSFTSMATHRSGDLVLGVSAGGVPAAATRLRDAVAERFDGRYASAVSSLAALRRGLLASGARDRWDAAARELLGEDFCASVESGAFEERVSPWR